MREGKFYIFRHDKIQGEHWYLEITSHRHGKNGFMPSQPKIDLAKLRSQISRRVDNSFPVFARLVWHAGHADRAASWVCHARHAGYEIGMPSVTDFDVRSSIIS